MERKHLIIFLACAAYLYLAIQYPMVQFMLTDQHSEYSDIMETDTLTFHQSEADEVSVVIDDKVNNGIQPCCTDYQTETATETTDLTSDEVLEISGKFEMTQHSEVYVNLDEIIKALEIADSQNCFHFSRNDNSLYISEILNKLKQLKGE